MLLGINVRAGEISLTKNNLIALPEILMSYHTIKFFLHEVRIYFRYCKKVNPDLCGGNFLDPSRWQG